MLRPSLDFGSGMAPPMSNRGSTEIKMKKKKRKAHRSTDRCIEKENVVRPRRNPTCWIEVVLLGGDRVAAAPARALDRVAAFHSRRSIGGPIRVCLALGWATTGDSPPCSPLHLPPRWGTRGLQGGAWGSGLDGGSGRSTSLREDWEI